MTINCRKFSFFFFLIAILASCAQINQDVLKNQQSTETTKIDDLATQADTAFKSGDYVKSANLYEKIVNQSPSDKDTLFYYAESLRILGSTTKAIEQYNKIIKLDQNNISALEGKGLAYLQNGELENALDQFNIVIKQDVSSWRAINAIGVIHSVNGNNEDAVQYYQMALKISHSNPSIINNIALGMAFGGEHEKAISLLKEAIYSMKEEGVKKQRLENNLALLYGISGKMGEAEKILRKNMPEPAVYNNLGFYAKLRSDKKLAWSYLSKAISTSPVYYAKAENNLQELSGASGGSNESIDSNSYSSEQGRQKAEALKARRGTHKLPLPSLRP